MNAPARIQPDPDRIEAAYRASISVHCPNQDEFTMNSRVVIAAIRDQASAGLRRCSDETYPILSHIATVATRAVYAPMPPGKVLLTRFALQQLMESARQLERAVNWRPRTDA